MPFSPSFSARQLKEQIESFAPPEYRKEREDFYSRLREVGKSAYKFILQAIVVAHDLYQSELTEKLARTTEEKKQQESLYW